jgi:hypothetical protein
MPKRMQQPEVDKRTELKIRAYVIYGYGSLSKLAKIFHTSEQHISNAFAGASPTLMNKIYNHLSRGKNENLRVQKNREKVSKK